MFAMCKSDVQVKGWLSRCRNSLRCDEIIGVVLVKRELTMRLATYKRCVAAVYLCLLSLTVTPAIAQSTPTIKRIDLAWVLEQTLLNNSQLQSYPYELRASEALTLQAGIRPNPKLSLSIENILGSGDRKGLDNAEVTLALSQLIELGDKRQRRIDLAQAEQQQQLTQYEILRLDVLALATERYYQLLRLQAQLSWNQQRLNIEQQALQTITTRANAGAVTQADVAKMALGFAASQARQQQLLGEVQLAKYQLAAMWNSEPQFEQISGDLPAMTQVPTAASVLNAMETAPQYLHLLSRERVLQAKWRFEQSKAVTDVNVGIGVRGYDGFDSGALMFNVSMPIALENPNQGNILAAKIDQNNVLEQQRIARSQLRLTLLEIHQTMVNNASQVQRLQTHLLPLAQQLLSDTQRAYQTGQANVLQLIDAQSELFKLQLAVIDFSAMAYQQLLELERITGQSMVVATPHQQASLETK